VQILPVLFSELKNSSCRVENKLLGQSLIAILVEQIANPVSDLRTGKVLQALFYKSAQEVGTGTPLCYTNYSIAKRGVKFVAVL